MLGYAKGGAVSTIPVTRLWPPLPVTEHSSGLNPSTTFSIR
jgi:hypothetical protein